LYDNNFVEAVEHLSHILFLHIAVSIQEG